MDVCFGVVYACIRQWEATLRYGDRVYFLRPVVVVTLVSRADAAEGTCSESVESACSVRAPAASRV